MNVRNQKKCGNFLLVKNSPILHHSGQPDNAINFACLFVCKDLLAQNCLQIFRLLPHGSGLYWDCDGLDRSEVCFSVRLDLRRRQKLCCSLYYFHLIALCTFSSGCPPLIFLIYSFEELSDLSEEQEIMLPFVPFPSGAVFSVSSLFRFFAQNSERSTTPRPLYMPIMVIVLL